MKTIILSVLVSLAAQAQTSGTYTLQQICLSLSSQPNSCQALSFCQSRFLEAQVGGCRAKPETPYFESLCSTLDPDLCNPQTTGCQLVQPSPARQLCVATRSYL